MQPQFLVANAFRARAAVAWSQMIGKLHKITIRIETILFQYVSIYSVCVCLSLYIIYIYIYIYIYLGLAIETVYVPWSKVGLCHQSISIGIYSMGHPPWLGIIGLQIHAPLAANWDISMMGNMIVFFLEHGGWLVTNNWEGYKQDKHQPQWRYEWGYLFGYVANSKQKLLACPLVN